MEKTVRANEIIQIENIYLRLKILVDKRKIQFLEETVKEYSLAKDKGLTTDKLRNQIFEQIRESMDKWILKYFSIYQLYLDANAQLS